MPRRHTVIVVCVTLALAGEVALAAQASPRAVAAAGSRLRGGGGASAAAARAGSVIGIVRAPNNAATAVV